MTLVNTHTIADEESLKKILKFIHQNKGLDLHSYRDNFLYRRLRLRMQTTKVLGAYEYIGLLEKSPEEYALFLDALSINVTEFFRDPDVFEAFKKNVLAGLITRKAASDFRSLRIWSSACASGEEAYSLAILIKEELKDNRHLVVKILATDIDAQALEKAKKAAYPLKELKKIPRDILKKYFTTVDSETYYLTDEIKQMVKFQQHNIFHTPGFKNIDVIFCRNIMIYLSRQQMIELFKKFHQLLNPGGFLVLGKVESLWERALFIPVDLRAKIYQKASLIEKE
ncbi:MAG: hypothetical protein A2Y00_05070 [Omnitrophica WOR_2 bacterium GWF2_43_52]|nr:MAG: hypothetical protein A2Y01_01900 [Omnitrophica WOR_2 bacterium GWC2_44_8]OGX20478.1 MAG: hypothetical protein A2Y00_05070 [Omnitrophica WOR_2 bacterium GWF2_43_52]HAH20533.1 chemotaxis protein CheR [Candidatus Omnitrophota bacterium]HBG62796.1 chemotaxis protein CheR [Candidatus Omnitrophota bacterium]HCD38349.1 chemotaxis protein CheR [Candidatus Omnitrophota bacterium]